MNTGGFTAGGRIGIGMTAFERVVFHFDQSVFEQVTWGSIFVHAKSLMLKLLCLYFEGHFQSTLKDIVNVDQLVVLFKNVFQNSKKGKEV